MNKNQRTFTWICAEMPLAWHVAVCKYRAMAESCTINVSAGDESSNKHTALQDFPLNLAGYRQATLRQYITTCPV